MLGVDPYYVWRFGAATVPAVPTSLDRTLSRALGRVAYALSPRARDNVRANLAVIAPDLSATDRERLVRETFRNQVWNYLQTFRVPRLTREELFERVRIDGWEHAERARAQGRGVIFASAHLGPLILVGQACSAMGIPLHVIAEPIAPRLFDLLNVRMRGRYGATFVPSTAALTIVRVLRRGEGITVLADRAPSGVGLRVPFFGREALLPAGHVMLAMRTGAPLVPTFAVREGDRYRAQVLPPIDIVPGRGEAIARENLARWAAVLEPFVAAAPEEWAVFERFWER